MAAALVAPPTLSPDRLYAAAPPQKSAEPGGRVHSEGGSSTTLLIAGGAVLAFAGGLGLGSLRRRSLRRRTAAAPPTEAPAAPTAETPAPAVQPPAPAAETPAPAVQTPAPIAQTAAPATVTAQPPAPQAPAPPRRPAPQRPPPAAAPRAEPSPPPVPEGPVFAPRIPWPEGTESMWRAEITWQSGYRRSEFRALAQAPAAKKRTVLATSREFRNLMKDPADIPRPELASAVQALMDALLEQGWTEVSPGSRWFNRRFVWNGPAAPPDV